MVNTSGILGLLIALCSGASFYLVREQEFCLTFAEYDQVQIFHIVGIVTGIILCAIGLINLPKYLREFVIILYLLIIATILVAGLMIYTSVLEFKMPCSIKPKLDTVVNAISGRVNIFDLQDTKMIAVFILDIVSGIMLFGAAGAFYSS